MSFVKQKFFWIFFIFGFLFLNVRFSFALAEGDQQSFFVEKYYDANQRDSVQARLVKVSQRAYFFIESDWYLNITDQERGIANKNLAELADSFDRDIYPKLTGFWGPEWSPGIDNDEKIFILFHQMDEGAAGYFNDANEYQKQQAPFSNEKEMVYLSTQTLKSNLVKSYLAHEFTHLISFNQKTRLKGVNEDIWLTEARAEYSPFYLGFDTLGKYGNLEQRINQFSKKPSDSLVVWDGEQTDYGIINVFIQYLAEKYSADILVSSLHSNKTGVDSLEESLKSKGQDKSFLDIFNDWAGAVALNDCSLGANFCYKTPELANLRIPANLVVLPSNGKTNLSLKYILSPWSSNWYRFIGSEGDLKFSFDFDPKAQFSLKYVLCEIKDGCKVFDFKITGLQNQELVINNFSQKYSSITLIPSVKPRFFNTPQLGDAYSFSVLAQTSNESSYSQDEALIKDLLAQIESLKAQISQAWIKLSTLGRDINLCVSLDNDLYFGLKSEKVVCLQEFLRVQGSDVYPQGIISGVFGPLTKTAVINFQEKYANEILTPLGLNQGTGYVGKSTREKINELLLKIAQK